VSKPGGSGIATLGLARGLLQCWALDNWLLWAEQVRIIHILGLGDTQWAKMRTVGSLRGLGF
jgi:hypothetical protein